MRNSLEIMWRERAFMVVLLLLVWKIHGGFPSSSCGQITNINYPFRFKGDPEKCGLKRYELGCVNNVTVLYLYSVKYDVQAINYKNYTVRVVDPALQHHNLSSLPLRFLSRSNFSLTFTLPFTTRIFGIKLECEPRIKLLFHYYFSNKNTIFGNSLTIDFSNSTFSLIKVIL